MKVKVKAYASLKRLLGGGGGKTYVELEEGASIKDLVLKLGGKVEASGNLLLGGLKLASASLTVMVNGRNVNSLDGVNIVLKEEDQVAFMPVAEGG